MAEEPDKGPRWHVLRDLAALTSPSSISERWRESLADLLRWAEVVSGESGCEHERYILKAVRLAVADRFAHRLFYAIADWCRNEGNAHTRTVGMFYAGELPPGPAVLDALLWFYPDDAADRLAAMPYDEFLRTPYWRCVRAMAMERDGDRCRMCNSAGPIQVHHRTYEHRGREHEHLDDLTTLCADCHQRHHKRP